MDEAFKFPSIIGIVEVFSTKQCWVFNKTYLFSNTWTIIFSMVLSKNRILSTWRLLSFGIIYRVIIFGVRITLKCDLQKII